jgi:hypothetical protein
MDIVQEAMDVALAQSFADAQRDAVVLPDGRRVSDWLPTSVIDSNLPIVFWCYTPSSTTPTSESDGSS